MPFKLTKPVTMPYEFTQVPLVNVANENLQDDTSCKNGCPKALNTKFSRETDPTIWAKFDYLHAKLIPTLMDVTNMSRKELEKMDFTEINHLLDMIYCLAFEGKDLIPGKKFDLSVLSAAREHLFLNTKEKFSDETRQLIYSKLMRKPL